MKPNSDPNFIHLHGIHFPRSWIYQHILVTGGSGTGKSHGILKVLTRQILAADKEAPELRPAMVVFDIKGDLLPIVKAALAQCGRQKDLIVVGIGDDEAVFNPLAEGVLTPTQIAQQLTLAASIAGQEASQRTKTEELFWSAARTDLLTSLIELTQVSLRDNGIASLSLEHLQRARGLLSKSQTKLLNWVSMVAAELSEASGNALQEWAHLPESTRGCIAASVGNVLAPWTREPLGRLVNPDPKRPLLNLREVVDHGKVVVINAAQTEHAEELFPGCVLLKQALFRLALSRSRQPVNQDRMVVIMIDEATRLISPHNHLSSEHVALEMARSNKVAFILAAQNLSGLTAISGDTLTDKLAALCGNQIFLGNNCPATLRLAQRCFGDHIVLRRHPTLVPTLPAPQLFPDDAPDEQMSSQITLVPVEVPVISASALSRMPPGAARAKLVDGSVHQFQCTFD
jgi:type IV secretory pathway TraG/TraD family ATPase VirD4